MLKSIGTAFGSLLVILPATSYSGILSSGSASDRMRSHWAKTGSQLKEALNEYQSMYDKKEK